MASSRLTGLLAVCLCLVATPGRAAQDEWPRVQALAPGTDITVSQRGQPPMSGRLLSADAAGIALQPTGGATSRTIARNDVVDVRARVARGSTKGAVVGGAIGGGLGFLSAFVLSYKSCGPSCADERFLMGASMVGMPAAGALIGYRLFGGPRLRTIYTRR